MMSWTHKSLTLNQGQGHNLGSEVTALFVINLSFTLGTVYWGWVLMGETCFCIKNNSLVCKMNWSVISLTYSLWFQSTQDILVNIHFWRPTSLRNVHSSFFPPSLFQDIYAQAAAGVPEFQKVIDYSKYFSVPYHFPYYTAYTEVWLSLFFTQLHHYNLLQFFVRKLTFLLVYWFSTMAGQEVMFWPLTTAAHWFLALEHQMVCGHQVGEMGFLWILWRFCIVRPWKCLHLLHQEKSFDKSHNLYFICRKIKKA